MKIPHSSDVAEKFQDVKLGVLLSCLSFLCRVCYGDDEVSPLGNIGPLQPGEWTRPRRWEGVVLIKAHVSVYRAVSGSPQSPILRPELLNVTKKVT